METVLIVVHLMVVVALVIVVLLQRSEGGALGIGGGGGGGFMSARGAANALSRTTAILAAGFFATSIALGIYAKIQEDPVDILNRVPVETGEDAGTILDQITPEGAGELPNTTGDQPQVPSGQ